MGSDTTHYSALSSVIKTLDDLKKNNKKRLGKAWLLFKLLIHSDSGAITGGLIVEGVNPEDPARVVGPSSAIFRVRDAMWR